MQDDGGSKNTMMARIPEKVLSFSLWLHVCTFPVIRSVNIRILATCQPQTLTDGRVVFSDAVVETKTQSLMTCFSECSLNAKCLTFFYNSETRYCVMHSKDFLYPTITTVMKENGWKFYITRDVSGRCPSSYYLNRHLDFCYNVHTMMDVRYSDLLATCDREGGMLSTVTNQELQDYFAHVLKGRTYDRVCMGGKVDFDYNKVVLDNGTMLSYTNWKAGEPDDRWNQKCIELYEKDKWFSYQCSHKLGCHFICEYYK